MRQQPGDGAFLGQDQLPGIDPDQVVRPERQHDRDIEYRLAAWPGIARHVIGKWEGDSAAGRRYDRRGQGGAADAAEAGLVEETAIARQRWLVHHLAGEVVDRKEALRQQRE